MGWSNKDFLTKSFKDIKLLKSGDVSPLEYVTGIKPDSYYEARNKQQLLKSELRNLENQRQVLVDVKQKVSSNANIAENIDRDSFLKELGELEKSFNLLANRQDIYKSKLHDLNSKKLILENHKSNLQDYKEELGKDFNFVQQNESIECPFCGAYHENSFENKYRFLEDANECDIALDLLGKELEGIDKQIIKMKGTFESNLARFNEINEVLSSKKQNYTVKDLISYESHKLACKDLDAKLEVLGNEINTKRNLTSSAFADMSEINKKGREALEKFRMILRRYLLDLDVSRAEINTTKKIYVKEFAESGEDVSRIILAYRFALVQTISDKSNVIYAPFVIDTPAGQQDQGQDHSKKILEFIFDNAPEGRQLILATKTLKGYVPNKEYKSINLGQKNKLLIDSDYVEAFNTFSRYIKQMNIYRERNHQYSFL
ncbi:MAG: hypothetical protein ACK5N8_01580 [Alphaproteobacteria bacterium]